VTEPQRGISVRDLVEADGLGIALSVAAGGQGMARQVRSPRIQKSGLALTGHFHGIEGGRIQILGMTELSYLRGLSETRCQQAVRGFMERDFCCVIVTQSAEAMARPSAAPDALVAYADELDVPLLLSPERSSKTIVAIHALLDELLAPRTRVHGVLVDVFEVGLLLLGPSGVGKSEVALELVMRGHRLVADDVVDCHFRPPGMVFGAAADLLRHHLEVRGLGILNIKDLFGVTAVRDRKRIDVVCQLVARAQEGEGDRLGLERRYHGILEVEIPELLISVRPGRDMASLLEIAARSELLKRAGRDPAREFLGRLEGTLLGDESAIPQCAPVAPARPVADTGPRPGPASRVPPESMVGLPPARKK
jgi:HPr kinase/phosphorylase